MTKQEYKPVFKGYMKLHLHSHSLNELMGKSVFTGEWATKRYQIMKKPRRYKVSLYLYNTAGDKAHEQVQMLDAGDRELLWQAICQFAQQIIDENSDVEFDKDKSYAVVRC